MSIFGRFWPLKGREKSDTAPRKRHKAGLGHSEAPPEGETERSAPRPASRGARSERAALLIVNGLAEGWLEVTPKCPEWMVDVYHRLEIRLLATKRDLVRDLRSAEEGGGA